MMIYYIAGTRLVEGNGEKITRIKRIEPRYILPLNVYKILLNIIFIYNCIH